MSTFDEHVVSEAQKYYSSLSKYSSLFQIDPDLQALAKSICSSAGSRSLNATYGGEHSDGGASASVREFASFLDGVAYGKQGNLSGAYGEMLNKIKVQENPEFKKYLELHAKYKDLL